MSHDIRCTRSELVQTIIQLEDLPFSLKDYAPFVDIYNVEGSSILLKTGRQVSKTTFLANTMILDAATHRYFKDLYVAPGRNRVQDFSNTKLDILIEGSKFISDYLVDTSKINRVFLKQFNNFSQIMLSYVDVDAERVRGISADRVLVDEVQMVLYDEVFPVLMACMDNVIVTGKQIGRAHV